MNDIKRHDPRPPASTDPFSALRSEMDRIFDQFMGPGGFGAALPSVFGTSAAPAPISPQTDIKETASEIVITTELPGLAEEDVTLSLDGNLLSIKGEKKTEEKRDEDNFHLVERRYGSFQRAFRLPETIDEEQVDAKLGNGVLKVTVAKKPEAQRAAKRISISKS